MSHIWLIERTSHLGKCMKPLGLYVYVQLWSKERDCSYKRLKLVFPVSAVRRAPVVRTSEGSFTAPSCRRQPVEVDRACYFRMPLRRFTGHAQLGGDPGVDPQLAGGTAYPIWATPQGSAGGAEKCSRKEGCLEHPAQLPPRPDLIHVTKPSSIGGNQDWSQTHCSFTFRFTLYSSMQNVMWPVHNI